MSPWQWVQQVQLVGTMHPSYLLPGRKLFTNLIRRRVLLICYWLSICISKEGAVLYSFSSNPATKSAFLGDAIVVDVIP